MYERTGGNVFYLLELVRRLESEYRDRVLTADDVINLDVPSGVRDVIARRVARSSGETLKPPGASWTAVEQRMPKT